MRKNNKTPETNIQPLLLTVEEAAKSLRCSRSSVYNLMDRGAIQSVKVGSLRRIRPSSLESFIERAGN